MPSSLLHLDFKGIKGKRQNPFMWNRIANTAFATIDNNKKHKNHIIL